MPFVLRSPAFKDGEAIPSRYTCDGANVSPPLEWSGAPAGVRSFLLVMDDPDAPGGTFWHWGLYGIMPERTKLPEGIGHGVKTEPMGHGVNDFGHPRYDGPAPPEGAGPHRYRFRLAALGTEAPVPVPKEPVGDLWEKARPHVLAEAVLTGRYARRGAGAPGERA
jgi:Raf kinase inhibitor-like YbhB/YbcL family protein